MARASKELLTTRVDVVKAALAATVAARDANVAREILERSQEDLSVLTDAVETLNHELAALSKKLAWVEMDGKANFAEQFKDLKKRMVVLEKAAKRSKKR
jgi:chromosome segregation ATPase